LAKKLATLKSELAHVDTELAKPKTRPFSFRVEGDIGGPVHLEMFHIKKLLDISDSRKEFQVTPESGLVSRSIVK
jgi:hypothetical protein